MNEYEITYILRPNLEDAEVEARSNAVAEIVRNEGGTVVAIERLGRKRLAYEIGDAREGSYVAMQFTGAPAVAKELERQLRLHEDVIRELLVRLDKQALAQMAAAKAAPQRPTEEPEESAEPAL